MQFQLVKTEKGINVEMFLNFFFCIMFLGNVWGEKKTWKDRKSYKSDVEDFFLLLCSFAYIACRKPDLCELKYHCLNICVV